MEMDFGIQTPGWPLPSYVTLQELLKSSVPLFPICKMGNNGAKLIGEMWGLNELICTTPWMPGIG